MKSTNWLLRILLLYIGILAIVFCRALIRYVWREINDVSMNMPAASGLLTSPLVALAILMPALMVELGISVFERAGRPVHHYLFLGACYGAVLSFTVSVLVGCLVVLLINPFTCRLVIDRATRGRAPV